MSAGVTIIQPVNVLNSYSPTFSGGIVSVIEAKYFKGVNYYQYFFSLVVDTSGVFDLEQFVEDRYSNVINANMSTFVGTGVPPKTIDIAIGTPTISVNISPFALVNTRIYLSFITY